MSKLQILSLLCNISKYTTYYINIKSFNSSRYKKGLDKLYLVLVRALSDIESIYYKYFLFKKLQTLSI